MSELVITLLGAVCVYYMLKGIVHRGVLEALEDWEARKQGR